MYKQYPIDTHQNNCYYVSMSDKVDLKNLPDLLTVREVADLLRVSPLTLKRWGKRGKLPAIRINSRGDRRYKKEQVQWLLGINLRPKLSLIVKHCLVRITKYISRKITNSRF